MYSFHGQTVIITGGTRGIGKGIAKAFLDGGATVIATYLSNDAEAEKFRLECGEQASRLHLRKFDVSNAEEVKAFFEDIERNFPTIEVLVNNSGHRKDNMLALMPENDWHKVIDVNLGGTYLMSKYATLQFMKNRYGRIINISSVGARVGFPGQANYAASKAGQIALSKSLAKELGKKGITVNNICPGFIETDLLSDLTPELVKEYKNLVPMKRFGKVEEVAHGVLFLASKEASYISGATLDIAGGV